MDYKTIMVDKLNKAMAEADRLEVEKERIENNLRFELARVSVYQELVDEFDTQGTNEEIIDLCDETTETTDTSYNV